MTTYTYIITSQNNTLMCVVQYYDVSNEGYHGVLSYSVFMLTYSLGDRHVVSC